MREGWVTIEMNEPKTRKSIVHHMKDRFDQFTDQMVWRD